MASYLIARSDQRKLLKVVTPEHLLKVACDNVVLDLYEKKALHDSQRRRLAQSAKTQVPSAATPSTQQLNYTKPALLPSFRVNSSATRPTPSPLLRK